MAYSKIRPRRGTFYEWSTYNPILSSGEMAIEYPDTGIGGGLCKIKFGNGVDKYTELAYAFDGTAAQALHCGSPSSFCILQLRTGTSQEWHDVNPILNEGEPGYCSTVNSIKVGDGQTPWNELEYIRCSSIVDNEYDFGNEEESEIYGNQYGNMLHDIEGAVDYPDSILPEDWDENINSENNSEEDVVGSATTEESTAGLDDLLSEEDEDAVDIDGESSDGEK
jgi:hypothetical protein